MGTARQIKDRKDREMVVWGWGRYLNNLGEKFQSGPLSQLQRLTGHSDV